MVLLGFIDSIFEKVQTLVPDDRMFDVLFVILTIVIDILTSVQLYRLARNVMIEIHTQTVDDQWEQNLEQKMNPLIHPKYAWLIGGLEFGNKYKGGSGGNDIGNGGNGNINNANVSDCDRDYSSPNSSASDQPTTNRRGQAQAQEQEQGQGQALLNISNVPMLCSMVFYFLNPITILATSIFPTFQGLQYLLLVSAFQEATSAPLTATPTATSTTSMPIPVLRSKVLVSTCLLAILAYFELHHVIFLSPLIGCIRHVSLGNSIRANIDTKQVIGCKFFSACLLKGSFGTFGTLLCNSTVWKFQLLS